MREVQVIHLSALRNVLVEIARCIFPNCRIYLSIWQNVFVCIAQCICSYMGPICFNIYPMLHIAQCISPNCIIYICPYGKMYLSALHIVFVHMGPIIWAICSNIHPMLRMAHCSCCSCLVCLWLTALLARGGSQKAGSQAGCLHMENSPAGNSSSPSSTLCWLCLSVSISTSCIVHQPAFLLRRRRNRSETCLGGPMAMGARWLRGLWSEINTLAAFLGETHSRC